MRRREFLSVPAAALPVLAPGAARPAYRTSADTPLEWRANWIWIPVRPGSAYKTINEQQSRNSYFYVRKTFDLDAVPAAAEARVSADSRYLLFVNGVRLGFGPARCDPRWQCYDVYREEVRKHLRTGKNVIAALVHHIGESTFAYILGRAGFLLEAEFGALKLATDHTWRAFPGLPWQYVPHRLSLQTDFPEIYDARLEPVGWNTLEFDDSRWQAPTLIGPPPVAPWGEMVPRDIPFFAEHDIKPAAALEQGTALAMQREYVLDTHEVFGRPEAGAPKQGKVTFEVHSPAAREAVFVIGYTHPFEVRVNGATILRSTRVQSGDSGYMVKHRLPAVALRASANQVVIDLELGGRIKNLHFGHIGEPAALEYRGWSAPARVSPQVEIAAIQQTELLTPERRPTVVPARIEARECDQYVLLDFGREVFGYPFLKIRNARAGAIDLGYSEMLVDGRAEPNKTGLSNADRYILRPGEQTWQSFEKRAFRYMQLDFRGLSAPVELESVGLRFSTYRVHEQGSFRCSDEQLNRIWEIGRYTVQLNMDDVFTDCPLRERAGWMGDARVEGLVAAYAFGDTKLLRRCLKLIGQSQTGDGLTYGIYPAAIDFRLPSFTLLWVHSIWDYYMLTDDRAFLQELYPKVTKALSFFERWVDEHGLIADLQNHYWVFIDWTRMDLRGETTPLNCFYAGTLDVAARMASELVRPQDASRLRSLADRTKGAVRRRLWSPEKAVFVDSRTADGPSTTVSQPANALAVLYGAAQKGTEAAIFRHILNPANQVVPVGSPYFSFYLLGAMYRAGLHDEALAYIRTHWSKMLDAGATTWWETWDGKESRCHGWSAGPTYDLIAEFAGVKPLSAGFRRVRIEPHPAGLDFAEATVPSPAGDLSVKWRVEPHGFVLEAALPDRCSAAVSLPRLHPSWTQVRAGGRPIQAVATAGRVQFDWAAGGKQTFILGAEVV